MFCGLNGENTRLPRRPADSTIYLSNNLPFEQPIFRSVNYILQPRAGSSSAFQATPTTLLSPFSTRRR